ncbi:N-acetylmuramoyl-L-alanine amidase [Nocardioides mangrovi]|uniref:N-acetylmuramoyl-L-alanine amidase n=1 Tax=Nocardioides mangrovi TaxID=2874580 RepID=A0ABS7UIH3_9ACTN|nr:N-acetylmuramoyl-L-alanine amidase [Nocardioides mangrovi]MBZ5740639.1 N-acetylmuramoyl-L-alanine amidase [Nocardioides mangrovi]
MSAPGARRRPLLIGLAGGAAALGAATVAARVSSSLHDGPAGGGPALTLSAESASMSSLSVPLDGQLLTSGSGDTARTARLTTSLHSMVGATWTGAAEPVLRIRSRSEGRWGAWQPLPHLHDRPDARSAEDTDLQSTQPVWTGDSDGIQVEVTGRRPADLTLVLLRPAPLPSDRAAVGKAALAASAADRARRAQDDSATGAVPEPPLLTRKDWGADESWRNGKPRYNSTIQQAHVHHTASGNDYSEDDVPAIIRGFYRYHTGTLGWSDIAYNFLVDRFGRIWVGRAGGPKRPVRGAHTLGFNATSVGTAVIGNFMTATPSKKVLQSIAAIAAWKLQPYGGDPLGTVRVDSEGSDKFRAGRVVALPVIDGHRDTNDTSCPGDHVYEHLPAIRRRAARIIRRAAQPPAVTVVTPSTLTGTPVVGQTLTVTPGTFDPAGTTSTCTWLRDGEVVEGATGLTYLLTGDDLGTVVSARVETTLDGHDPAVEDLAGPGTVEGDTTLTLKVRPHVRSAKVKVRVRVVDADRVPTGTVTITVEGQRQEVALVDGVAVARFGGLRPGAATATATYAGATGLRPAEGSADLVVASRTRHS